jgi:hypothetical protein
MTRATEWIPRTDTVDESDALGSFSIRWPSQPATRRARQADHTLKLDAREDVWVNAVAILALELGVKRSKAWGQKDGISVQGFHSVRHVQIDGTSGTGLHALATTGAILHVDEPGIRHRTQAGRAVYGPGRCQPSLIIVRASLGTHLGAVPTAGALCGINEAGFVTNPDPKRWVASFLSFSVYRLHLGIGQQADTLVQIAFESGTIGGLLGKHETDATRVCGKGVVKQVHGAADGGCTVEETDAVAEVGKVQGGGHTGNASPDDECCLAILTCFH